MRIWLHILQTLWTVLCFEQLRALLGREHITNTITDLQQLRATCHIQRKLETSSISEGKHRKRRYIIFQSNASHINTATCQFYAPIQRAPRLHQQKALRGASRNSPKLGLRKQAKGSQSKISQPPSRSLAGRFPIGNPPLVKRFLWWQFPMGCMHGNFLPKFVEK